MKENLLQKYNVTEDQKPSKAQSTLRRTLGLLWELPQTLLALPGILFHCIPKAQTHYVSFNGISYHFSHFNMGGVSLGQHVFLNENTYNNKESFELTIRHEFGHTRQSLFFGPLYLILVGIPSFFRSFFFALLQKEKEYYEGYPENWADKLGKAPKRIYPNK